MNNKKNTLTIGIPAHNEVMNLPRLIQNIEQQLQGYYDLEKIMIVSDGSTDSTTTVIKKLNNPRVELHVFPVRMGKSIALTYITQNTESDILLLLDADVTIKQKNFIDSLIQPINVSEAGLTSAKVVAEKGTTFFSKILYISNKFKEELYESWKKGNTIYTCHGRAIAMIKKLYKQIEYEHVLADDALAFLYAQKMGLKYQYVPHAEVRYQLPKNFEDHMKQSSRFLQSQKQFLQMFENDLINKNYQIPVSILIKKMLIFLLSHPFEMSMFIAVFIYMKAKSMLNNQYLTIWEVAQTSKS